MAPFNTSIEKAGLTQDVLVVEEVLLAMEKMEITETKKVSKPLDQNKSLSFLFLDRAYTSFLQGFSDYDIHLTSFLS